jgi:hypothetical protein
VVAQDQAMSTKYLKRKILKEEIESRCQLCKECEETIDHFAEFEVLTAVSMKMAVFWVVAPYSLVEVYQHFRGPCCLHHQGNLSSP